MLSYRYQDVINLKCGSARCHLVSCIGTVAVYVMNARRDLLHIAGMGSALGVGFSPNSPDPRHQAEQQQVDQLNNFPCCTVPVVYTYGSLDGHPGN
jgi:hypothetical protein